MDYLNALLPTIENFGLLGYWIIFLISIVESIAFIGLFVPGTVLLVAIGALCAKGVLNPGDVIWFAAAGAVAGDVFSFYLGRHGTRLASRWDKIIHSSYMEHGERFLEAHGNKSVFLGRFVGPLRPVIPFVAGFFRMQPRRFIFWDVISAPCWATVSVYSGYFFGQAWEFSKLWTSRGGILLIVFGIILGILYFLRWEIIKRGREFFAFICALWDSFARSMIMNSDFQMYMRHHPVVFDLIKRRLDRRSLLGLPLTLIGFAMFYALILYLGVVEGMIRSDVVNSIDMRLANLLAVFRHPRLNNAMTWISLLGETHVVMAFAVVFSLLLFVWRRPVYIMPLWLTLAGSIGITLISGLAFYRPGPAAAVFLESSSSFPSLHACLVVAFYGFILCVLLRHVQSYNMRMNLLFACVIVMLAVGFSRIYLGAHFLSDVWIGYGLGCLWLVIGLSLIEWRQTATLSVGTATIGATFSRRAVSAALMGAGLVFFIGYGYRYELPAAPAQGEIAPVVLTDNIPMLFELQGLSRYTETLSGRNQEPLSLLIVALNDRQLLQAFQRSGWHRADEVTLGTLARMVGTLIRKVPYPTAPIPPSFWDNRVQDFGFQRPFPDRSDRQRQHVRLWRTHLRSADGWEVYVGTASLDIGARWGIAHKIWPDIDREREYLLQSLLEAGMVEWHRKVAFVDPVKGRHIGGNLFSTDGDLSLIRLR